MSPPGCTFHQVNVTGSRRACATWRRLLKCLPHTTLSSIFRCNSPPAAPHLITMSYMCIFLYVVPGQAGVPVTDVADTVLRLKLPWLHAGRNPSGGSSLSCCRSLHVASCEVKSAHNKTVNEPAAWHLSEAICHSKRINSQFSKQTKSYKKENELVNFNDAEKHLKKSINCSDVNAN